MNYTPHPVAEMFPLIDPGTPAWNELVNSIRDVGQIDPIVVDGATLIDGRNRLAVCRHLKIEPRTIAWSKVGNGADVAEWIFAKNVERRHLTPDQQVAIYLDFDKWRIAKTQEEAKAKAQFKPGSQGGPGRGKTARSKPSEPFRDLKAESERSTVGRVARGAKVSTHKARQVVAVAKAVDSGEVPPDTMEKVRRGEVKLKDAVKAASPKPPEPLPKPTLKEHVLAKLQKFIRSFGEDQSSEVKAIILEALQ